ncbi:MAG: isochorismatase family protein [Anaerolineae bacterium]|nr:isochorismatase family protein [Anaerolineae bacterium]
MPSQLIKLLLERQALDQDATGHTIWRAVSEPCSVAPDRMAIIVCDMWDRHWSRGATERVDQMAPSMNAVLERARSSGVHIIHAPSDTLAHYADHPARLRMLAVPHVEPPADIPHADPPLPIDDSDEGSDTGETVAHRVWMRQHPAIAIDEQRDLISDNGREVYSFIRLHSIELVLIMGVHTNMCVLNRSFGIKQMVRWGIPIALVRDLTDTMYNPARSPYVSHAEGTRLVVGFIGKFWCPTLTSRALCEALD